MGTAVGDYDNDGDLDLFLTSFGPDAMFRNNGDGTFTDVTDRGRRQRSAVEHQRRVPRLRPRRRSRSVRRQLSRLHARRQQDLLRSGRRARLLQPACVSARSRSALSQRRQRALHERHRSGRHQPRRRRGPWRERSATTTAMAGSISTSPTTRPPISSGSTAATGRSRTKACSREPRSMPRAILKAAWASRPATSTPTATKTCSSPTSSARRSRCTRTTARETSRTPARGGAWRSRPPPSPASARSGSTSITTGGWICSSPTAPSTSSKRSAGSRIRSG